MAQTGTLVEVDDASLQWLVVRTKSRQERVALQHLAQRGVEPYCPLFLEPPWHPRAPKGPVPLFAGYLFVECRPRWHLNAVRYCPGVLEGDYSSSPLREALDRDHGIRLVRAKQIIRAVLATRRLADLLAVKIRAPLLYVERISYSQHNTPIEFLRTHYRADRYSLYNELQG